MQMRNILTPFAVLLLLALTACDPGEIQAKAQRICGWVEPLTNIAAIVAASPITTTADALANAICAAAQQTRTASGKRGTARPMVNGVPLRGSFGFR